MEERPSTPALQEFPQLSRLHFFSPQNQGVIADYLAHLRARRYVYRTAIETGRACNRRVFEATLTASITLVRTILSATETAIIRMDLQSIMPGAHYRPLKG